jgi:hypothetical protein
MEKDDEAEAIPEDKDIKVLLEKNRPLLEEGALLFYCFCFFSFFFFVLFFVSLVTCPLNSGSFERSSWCSSVANRFPG